MEAEPNHMCMLLRIGNFYLGLTLFQLTLTLSYLITFHLAMIEIASWIQIWLAAFILLDLSIKFFTERQKFLINRWNIVDILILSAILVSIGITCTHTDGLHHQTGNTFGAVMVTARYTIQMIRVLMLLKASKQLREQQKYSGMISLKPGSDLQAQIDISI